MDDVLIKIADVYVPVKRRRTLDQATVDAIAESVIEEGLKIPILVRRMVNDMCSSRAYTGLRHAAHSARKRSWQMR